MTFFFFSSLICENSFDLLFSSIDHLIFSNLNFENAINIVFLLDKNKIFLILEDYRRIKHFFITI